jgi:hypothetical protein
MTEAEWLNCTNPRQMLSFLRKGASDRKLRLAAIACTRRLQHRPFFVRAIQHALDMAEQDADGLASHEEMATARATAKAVGGALGLFADWAVSESSSAFHAAWACVCGVANEKVEVWDLIRDIFHYPDSPATFDPAWRTWHQGLLVSMAQKMYDSREFSDMPVLADALEEAACQDQDILGHCRSGGEHVRGCWVIDLVLGKS